MIVLKMEKMKYIKMLLLAVVCTMGLASCMDGDWDAPDTSVAPFGNNSLQETNVMKIGDLRAKYASVFFNSTNSLQQIADDVQIKGRVVGNDIGGNIYNNVVIDDGTGAILICISQGGLFGYMPVGQEILVSLKDLWVGGYGQQPQIGTPYTNKNGNTYVSRMNRNVWNDHFKLVGSADASAVVPVEFDQSKVKDEQYMKDNCGKLMTIKGVAMADADGIATFAPEDLKDAANCVNRGLKGFSTSNIVVRTSTYADFAATKMPTEKLNITGIFTRYRNTWQIIIRSDKDIEAAK